MSIYGIGSPIGQAAITQPEGYLWGTVDAISQYGIQWVSPGYSVLFNDRDVQCRLAYPTDNTSYTLIAEAKLVCREIPLP